jgi:hypothetical protein
LKLYSHENQLDPDIPTLFHISALGALLLPFPGRGKSMVSIIPNLFPKCNNCITQHPPGCGGFGIPNPPRCFNKDSKLLEYGLNWSKYKSQYELNPWPHSPGFVFKRPKKYSKKLSILLTIYHLDI